MLEFSSSRCVWILLVLSAGKDRKCTHGHRARPQSRTRLENVLNAFWAQGQWLTDFPFFFFLGGGGVPLSDLWLAERCASLPWTPSAAFRLQRRRHPRWEAKAVAGCLAHDSVSKNTSTETQAYAHASVWRSSRLCFSLSPSKCWSEELNYSRRPARVWFATVCFLVAFEWDPWSKAFRDQPVLWGSVTWRWRQPAPSLSRAWFSVLLGRARALGRGGTWPARTPMSLLWLLLPSARVKAHAGRWVTSLAILHIFFLLLNLVSFFFLYVPRVWGGSLALLYPWSILIWVSL